jgi:endonuclease YncB( thermonuclease family)
LSLNHKRRIFRSNAGLAALLPSMTMVLAAVGGAAALLLVASLFVHTSNAPASNASASNASASNASAQVPPNGHVSAGADKLAVVDGDTLRVGEHVVRLEGIAAPARGSTCRGAGRPDMDCGSAAANALSSLVRGSSVDCTIHGHDDEGRPLGSCVAAGQVLNVALVRDGWARAETAALREPEATARAARLGIWQSGS